LQQLMSVSEALHHRDVGRDLAVKGEIAEACYHLGLATLSLRQARERAEVARSLVLLGWAQDVDGRPWQAAATLREAISSPEFEQLAPWVRVRALYTYARALWSLGDYEESLARGEQAYKIPGGSSERGWAALAVAQAALCLGLPMRASEAFDRAIALDPSLEVAAYGIRAYLHNLAGRHQDALREAEEGLRATGHNSLESLDKNGRAAESIPLMVELGTAKAFLGAADARQAILEARRRLVEEGRTGNVDLELARTNRGLAMVLAGCGECSAASALLTEASRVFSRRGAQSEHGLTFRVLSYIARKEGKKREVTP